MLEKRDAIEKEIASLEETLDGLQSDEHRRHSDMIKERSLEILAASSSSDATAITSVRSDSNESSGDSADDIADDMDNFVAMTPAAAAAMQTVVNT